MFAVRKPNVKSVTTTHLLLYYYLDYSLSSFTLPILISDPHILLSS